MSVRCGPVSLHAEVRVPLTDRSLGWDTKCSDASPDIAPISIRHPPVHELPTVDAAILVRVHFVKPLMQLMAAHAGIQAVQQSAEFIEIDVAI